MALPLCPCPATGSLQKKVKRGAISAIKADVILDDCNPIHDRSYEDIIQLISDSRISSAVKSLSTDIFRNLGEAEAKIHGIPLKDIHFHEVGAIDSIIDIVGVSLGFELLDITRFYSSPFPVCGGSVVCSHGTLPLPAPATLNLLAAVNAPVMKPPIEGMEGKELVTPTGAAIIASLAEFRQPELNLTKIGYGAGSRDEPEYPNILRIWMGYQSEQDSHADMVLLETNIDDMNPQFYGYVMENLFRQGALDVWFTPIQMKKNRPAIMLSVLATAGTESNLIDILMRETTTLGIRVRPVSRHTAVREIVQINSTYGPVKVKIKKFKDEVLSISPEYEDCRSIAAEKDIPLKEVYSVVEAEARALLT